jgi:hypothetical protein
VHILNTASYKTLEKIGFKREGHIREGKMVNTYCDYYLYGMTKADYIALHAESCGAFEMADAPEALSLVVKVSAELMEPHLPGGSPSGLDLAHL